MKTKLLTLLLAPSIALAQPTMTTTSTIGGDGKVEWVTHLWSHHHYHIKNDTGVKQIYNLTMNLCAVDKGQCKTVKTILGLENGQEIDFDRELHLDVIYRGTGDHQVNASTVIEGMPQYTSGDQKYVWIHY